MKHEHVYINHTSPFVFSTVPLMAAARVPPGPTVARARAPATKLNEHLNRLERGLHKSSDCRKTRRVWSCPAAPSLSRSQRPRAKRARERAAVNPSRAEFEARCILSRSRERQRASAQKRQTDRSGIVPLAVPLAVI